MAVEKSKEKKEIGTEVVTQEKETDKKKSEKQVKYTKTQAVVNGRDLRLSTKEAVAVCNFIRNKPLEKALVDLEAVSLMKRAVPMKGEIPHRKGKGMMSGRYPQNAVKEFIRLVNNLKSNAIASELELEKFKLFCMANQAARPQRKGGMQFKRSHVQIKLIPTGGKKHGNM